MGPLAFTEEIIELSWTSAFDELFATKYVKAPRELSGREANKWYTGNKIVVW